MKIKGWLKIGFLSDTDGLYYRKYISNFKDCQIIVPHLGSIHGIPKGYKHLYKDGLEKFLKYLPKKKDQLIILSEFGFELSSSIEFNKGIKSMIPFDYKYCEIIDHIEKFVVPILKN